uniref:acid phosphatase n=1 Tax=Theropithecus gelada TaxID=9565 RepID=A0A8D2FF09_THEGE
MCPIQCCVCVWVTHTPIAVSHSFAEATFRKGVMIKMFHIFWRIDHAVTSTYEIGNPPDYREENCMKKHGMPMNHMVIKKKFELEKNYFILACLNIDMLRNILSFVFNTFIGNYR